MRRPPSMAIARTASPPCIRSRPSTAISSAPIPRTRRRRRVLGIGADEIAVEGRDRMHGGEAVLAMAIEGGRRIRRDQKGQNAAALRRLRGTQRLRGGEPCQAEDRSNPSEAPHRGSLDYLSSHTVPRSWFT